jgi:hypothetical protein
MHELIFIHAFVVFFHYLSIKQAYDRLQKRDGTVVLLNRQYDIEGGFNGYRNNAYNTIYYIFGCF